MRRFEKTWSVYEYAFAVGGLRELPGVWKIIAPVISTVVAAFVMFMTRFHMVAGFLIAVFAGVASYFLIVLAVVDRRLGNREKVAEHALERISASRS